MHEEMYHRKSTLNVPNMAQESNPFEENQYRIPIDFDSVALYIPGLQIALSLGACCMVTIAVSVVSPFVVPSAVRTITVTAIVGMCCTFRPLVIARARGIDVMFDALRPAVIVYLLALVLEQLVHSCGPSHQESTLSLRHWAFYAASLVMCISGFWQAYTPRSLTDYPFIISAGSLVIVAIFTPPPRMGEGPLCEPPIISIAIERVFRALLFGAVYCALAYGSAPVLHSVREVGLCSIKSAAGSIWVLCIHRFFIWISIVQVLLVMWVRIRDDPNNSIRPGAGIAYGIDHGTSWTQPQSRDVPFEVSDDSSQHLGASAFNPSEDGAETPLQLSTQRRYQPESDEEMGHIVEERGTRMMHNAQIARLLADTNGPTRPPSNGSALSTSETLAAAAARLLNEKQ